MENPSAIERLRHALESEEAKEELNPLPPDTYVRLGSYAQKLRATTAPNNEDASGRLARKQLWLIEIMTARLLEVRLSKARLPSDGLLPEERRIADLAGELAKKQERFVRAVVDGQPSFFTLVQRRERQRMTTVRMVKRVGEIIGADLKRYGPFETNDVARLPQGNAQVMVANHQAIPVSSGEY